MTDAQFMQLVLIPEAGTVGGKLNLERLTLTPLFTIDDEFFFDVLGDRINPATGLLDDPTPPFKLYLSNENQLENGVNPFAPEAFEDRWYQCDNGNTDGQHYIQSRYLDEAFETQRSIWHKSDAEMWPHLPSATFAPGLWISLNHSVGVLRQPR